MGNTMSLIQLPSVIKLVNDLSLRVQKLELQVKTMQEDKAAKQQSKPKKND
jgi:hypothetical protein